MAAAVGAPIGFFGGLIGLAGSEFRLPLLLGLFNYSARRAVPLNLAVSLITLSSAMAIRIWGLHAFPSPLPIVLTMTAGGAAGAYIGATWVSSHASESGLRVAIRWLLVVVGLLLMRDGFAGAESALVEVHGDWAIAAAGLLGLGFGALRGVLGISGGVMPALILLFGLGVNEAVTATMVVNLPAALVGSARYARAGWLGERRDWTQLVLPMGVASGVAALGGAALASAVPAAALKVALGVMLVATSLLLVRRR